MRRWLLLLLLLSITWYATRLRTHLLSPPAAPAVTDESSGVAVLRMLAAEGHAGYQYDLGSRYYYGQGVTKDEAQAASWFKKAAGQGHPTAQTFLGIMFRKGQGMPTDLTEAIRWLQKAAAVGEPRAQSVLGIMTFTGEGGARNPVEAYKLETLAASRATDDELKRYAVDSRQRMAMSMSKAEIEAAEAQALEWSEAWAALEDLVREKALRTFCKDRPACPVRVDNALPSKRLLDQLRDQPKFTPFVATQNPDGTSDSRGVIDVEGIQWRGPDKALIRISTYAGRLNAYAATLLVQRSVAGDWRVTIVPGSEMMS